MSRVFLAIIISLIFIAPAHAAVTESWDCSDSDSITCDLTWTEFGTSDIDIVSNVAQSQTCGAFCSGGAQAASDTGSADHYVEVDITVQPSALDADATAPGLMCRRSDGVETYYLFRSNDRTTDAYQMYEVTSGSSVQLGADVSEDLPTVPYTLRFECEGDQLRGYANGVLKITRTDSSLSGQYAGIRITNASSSSAAVSFDDFEADVISSGVATSSLIFPSGSGSLEFLTGSGSVLVK